VGCQEVVKDRRRHPPVNAGVKAKNEPLGGSREPFTR
jgi:hypothetical protein